MKLPFISLKRHKRLIADERYRHSNTTERLNREIEELQVTNTQLQDALDKTIGNNHRVKIFIPEDNYPRFRLMLDLDPTMIMDAATHGDSNELFRYIAERVSRDI